jgi:DnaJ-class molecular chaperone
MPPPPQLDFDPRIDYYKALGIETTSNSDDIKRSYRKLAKQLHPDATGGDKTKESRFRVVQTAYDVLGDAKKKQLYDEIRAGRFSRGIYGQNDVPAAFDLGDLFNEFFNGTAPPQRPGRVRVEHIHFDGDRFGAADDAEFESRVQASDGSWLHVEGNDVYSDVRVSFDHAILGTVATIATIDARADIKIPPGTSSGKKLRLRGKGVIGGGRRFGHVGDHYVTVQIDVPAKLDEESKKLLAQLVRRQGRHE